MNNELFFNIENADLAIAPFYKKGAANQGTNYITVAYDGEVTFYWSPDNSISEEMYNKTVLSIVFPETVSGTSLKEFLIENKDTLQKMHSLHEIAYDGTDYVGYVSEELQDMITAFERDIENSVEKITIYDSDSSWYDGCNLDYFWKDDESYGDAVTRAKKLQEEEEAASDIIIDINAEDVIDNCLVSAYRERQHLSGEQFGRVCAIEDIDVCLIENGGQIVQLFYYFTREGCWFGIYDRSDFSYDCVRFEEDFYSELLERPEVMYSDASSAYDFVVEHLSGLDEDDEDEDEDDGE